MTHPKNIKIFVASSGEEELAGAREQCIKVFHELNKAHVHLHLEAVHWEYDLVPGNYPDHGDFQSEINEILKQCEVVVFLFFKRFGKFTQVEYQLTKSLNKKMILYFHDLANAGGQPGPNDPLSIFRNSISDTINQREFRNEEDLYNQLYKHLNLYLSVNFSNHTGSNASDIVYGEAKIQSDIHDLIAKGKTGEALDQMRMMVSKDYENEVIMLLARFNSVSRDDRLGIITKSEKDVQLARINNAILQLLGELVED